MRRRLALVLLVGAAVTTVPIAVASTQASTLALSIVHVVRGCHVWSTGARTLGPATTISVRAGTRLRVRATCPMDFELKQAAGPKLALGDSRFYTGTTRTLVFRKTGVYKLVAKNVQTSDEVGLETLGEDNSLKLTVRVR